MRNKSVVFSWTNDTIFKGHVFSRITFVKQQAFKIDRKWQLIQRIVTTSGSKRHVTMNLNIIGLIWIQTINNWCLETTFRENEVWFYDCLWKWQVTNKALSTNAIHGLMFSLLLKTCCTVAVSIKSLTDRFPHMKFSRSYTFRALTALSFIFISFSS